jgi:hypothetical protein
MQCSSEKIFWLESPLNSEPVNVNNFNSCVNFVQRNSKDSLMFTGTDKNDLSQFTLIPKNYIIELIVADTVYSINLECKLLPNGYMDFAIALLTHFKRQDISTSDFDSITGFVRALTQSDGQKARYVSSKTIKKSFAIIQLKNVPLFMIKLLNDYAM